ncbi:hypothetical protein V8C44DRAFT_314317 [Trichoderma aethiopicum]
MGGGGSDFLGIVFSFALISLFFSSCYKGPECICTRLSQSLLYTVFESMRDICLMINLSIFSPLIIFSFCVVLFHTSSRLCCHLFYFLIDLRN